ncbi:hypothetical protein SUGI_1075600 [Cryptomeria japonica]|uniref:uncharacterized protein LOC131076580 n=1 Tax=Cryptomeria japonica TaxID=3369 RepID=UPI002414CD7A|nr:uncharacterized protein LOC131076580 [Cryptomeria japonica]XP_057869817.1 uncharacterized protein LOC131076580 [Cryptomeria japonica]GLJ50477.1 hypothetical protein SUGI_1075600 [Cryptomeria japonica]
MDLNLENFTSPVITSIMASNNLCNKDDTSLKHGRQVHSRTQKIHDHLFCSIDRSGSVPCNASLPKEIQRQCLTFHEAQSISPCFDDDFGLALGLGCNRCSSLPKTTSSALVSFDTPLGGSFGTMQLGSSLTGKVRHGQELPNGTTLHNTIEGHQNVASSKVSSICTHTGVSQIKSEMESKDCSRATVTKSLDIDPDILQLGLSTASPELGRQTVINPVVVVSQSDGALVHGLRQEAHSNGIETHRSTQIPVNEGSTSAQTESRCYIQSLFMAPRMENSGADSFPQLGISSVITNHPLQNSPETTRTSCRMITSNGSLGNEEKHSTFKTCKFTGCYKGARGSSGLCISHGGGNRCQKSGCTKGAESRTVYCKAHGGGRRCQQLGCTKSAEGKTDFCIGHGGGRRCSHQGCSKAARGRSGLCIRHGGGKRCQKEGCLKSAECYSSLCISHGGGRRCQYPECTKGAQGSTLYCKAHGGGKRCTYTGCNKGAEGSTSLCKGHGGGKRCMFDGGGICPKSVHGGTQFCVAHGGGKRCSVEGCTKSARGRTDYCVRHGGGKRCKFEGCGKSAQGSTDFCKAHGGGKRCLWDQEGSVYSHEVHGMNGQGPCDRYARGKIGLCAAHSALVQDRRSHGGKALGPGTGPGLFHGLARPSMVNATINIIEAGSVLSESLPLVTGIEWESSHNKASGASNCVVEQSINKVDNGDLEPGAKKKDGQEDELTLTVKSQFQLKTKHLAKWNMHMVERKTVEVPSSVDSMNIDTDYVVENEGTCRYQSTFAHLNNATGFDPNFTSGCTEVVGSTIGKQDTCIGLPSDQEKTFYQLLGSTTLQPLNPHKVLAPFPIKEGLKTLQTEVGHFSLPEGRVHGGSLMSMLSRGLRPGNAGFVPFSPKAFESGKQAEVQSNSGMF